MQCVGYLYALADVSFVIIDLKYNRKQGVKICEMQPGSFSRFSGVDPSVGISTICQMYCDFLGTYKVPVYFTHPLYKRMKEEFVRRDYLSAYSVESLATKIGTDLPKDPDNLCDYSCFLFSLKASHITQGYPLLFPQILFLDRAILPYSHNKYLMNLFFEGSEETKKLRPKWGLYQKNFSEELVQTVFKEIPGDRVVIKPLESTMGRGVIILEKKNLFSTLNYIFNSRKEVLLEDKERSYSHYAVDESDHFIVEEFIESDPLFLGENKLPYDCTMRVMAMFSYHLRAAQVHFLANYWYSPNQPIDKAYTLIQSHKAKGTFFSKVDPEIWEEVESQLTPGLLTVYKRLLVSSAVSLLQSQNQN